jgi:hypothetical protein
MPSQGTFLSRSHEIPMITKDSCTYSIRILRQD